MSELLRRRLSNILEAHLSASATAQYLAGVMTQIAALGADYGAHVARLRPAIQDRARVDLIISSWSRFWRSWRRRLLRSTDGCC